MARWATKKFGWPALLSLGFSYSVVCSAKRCRSDHGPT